MLGHVEMGFRIESIRDSLGSVPEHSESAEARWLRENYAIQAQPGAPYAGQWVVVQGERIVTGFQSPADLAAYVQANYENPADVLIARLIGDPLG